MLSAQHKEFVEDPKKKDEGSPYPHSFSRWYALDYFARPSRFKSRRFQVTLATTVLFTLLTAATLVPGLHRTHQAARVSSAHAMFNQKCSNCHTGSFAPLARLFGCLDAVSISDKTCNDCHHGATHHAKSKHEPSCVTCHREHTGHETLASHVASRHCTECHADLTHQLKAEEKTTFHAAITSFNRDHPEFKRAAPGQKDGAKIKFNHKAHLDLSIDDLRLTGNSSQLSALSPQLGSQMACSQCHQMDAERRYMLPISYDKHCASCHQLNVALVGDFAKDLKPKAAEFMKTPLPHKEPAVVRAVLRDRLLDFAQRNAVVSAKAEPIAVPRPLPWKPTPEVSKEHWITTLGQAKAAEDLLFMNKQWSKTEHLTWCSHCHIEETPNQRVDGLPVYLKTAIPTRWHEHSVFSHGAHRMMGCVECHDKNAAGVRVADSKSAADILLPTIKSCQECHQPSGGARNACVECHRYHDRSQQRDPHGWMGLHDVVRKNR